MDSIVNDISIHVGVQRNVLHKMKSTIEFQGNFV